MYLLRNGRRLELDLLRRNTPDPPSSQLPEAPEFILLVAANVRLSPDPAARTAFERELRAVIERRYARQGIADVRYDLQLL
jgi:hypothetical protein